ncbi:short neuropeptide F-like isoform X2 [Anoplophora glabripennis]|uniref:short neuropeptide F-like isoform X2 n=1 Tax=Anoplophora glabripennis TaxID=217634 RepID=UPI000874325F|nr:short neuropeptide F-like isoform X2 [Anoplophora glabripennis]
MNPSSAIKFFCVIFSILIALAVVSAAPYSSDYDNNIRDLFEILMQRDNLEDRMGLHQVVRKSRGPQLRLRFGKRPDAGYEPISAYMSGISADGEN